MKPRGLFGLWVWLVYVLIALSTISACAPYLEQPEPSIVLAPTTGGPGVSVAVSGVGFPGYIPVSVRLGPPSMGATPRSYGNAVTDAEGRFSLVLSMPVQWPDGTPIKETDLVVVVLNEDGSTKATAPFGYHPSSSGASPAALTSADAHQQVILSWHREGDAAGFCGDVVVYEGGYVEITSCQAGVPLVRRRATGDAAERLHTWTETYKSFDVERTRAFGESRVITRITFAGRGSRLVSEIEIQMIQTLLETIVSSE